MTSFNAPGEGTRLAFMLQSSKSNLTVLYIFFFCFVIRLMLLSSSETNFLLCAAVCCRKQEGLLWWHCSLTPHTKKNISLVCKIYEVTVFLFYCKQEVYWIHHTTGIFVIQELCFRGFLQRFCCIRFFHSGTHKEYIFITLIKDWISSSPEAQLQCSILLNLMNYLLPYITSIPVDLVG